MSLFVRQSDKDHVQGNENAFIELVEFGDFQCRHCGNVGGISVGFHYGKLCRCT